MTLRDIREIASQRPRVGVLMGGDSRERDISLASGTAVADALETAGLEVDRIDVHQNDTGWLSRVVRCDIALIAMHGGFGEGGGLQRRLEVLGVPYTGSGPRASALCLDKLVAKMLLRDRGVAMPRGIVVDSKRTAPTVLRRIAKASLGWPVVMKPRREGSSIGVHVVASPDALAGALLKCQEFEDGLLIEEYLPGREMTVAILGDRVLPIVELSHSGSVFDYQAKYQTKSGTIYMVDPALPDTLRREITDQALRAHRILGCEGMSRVDVRLDLGGRPYVLEINTVPGFTPTSLLPKAAAAAGIDFASVCLDLIDHGLRRGERDALPRWDFSISGRWQSPSGHYRAPMLEVV